MLSLFFDNVIKSNYYTVMQNQDRERETKDRERKREKEKDREREKIRQKENYSCSFQNVINRSKYWKYNYCSI